jgi:hypothetical protein
VAPRPGAMLGALRRTIKRWPTLGTMVARRTLEVVDREPGCSRRDVRLESELGSRDFSVPRDSVLGISGLGVLGSRCLVPGARCSVLRLPSAVCGLRALLFSCRLPILPSLPPNTSPSPGHAGRRCRSAIVPGGSVSLSSPWRSSRGTRRRRRERLSASVNGGFEGRRTM